MKNVCTRRHRRNSPGGKRAGKRAVQALAAGAAIAAGTSAYASPVRFDNPSGPGRFEWVPTAPENQCWLNVALLTEQQPNIGSPSSLSQIAEPTDVRVDTGLYGLEVQVGGPYGVFAEGVASGVVIPSGFAWGAFGWVYLPGVAYVLPPNQATYLGVRFDLGAGTQYGWIGVIMDQATHTLDAFAWGYETEPGVPIPAGAPEPGTLALLAFGALLRRRR